MIAFARWPTSDTLGYIPHNLDLTIKGMALVGTLIGQVVFGLMGDQGGRKRVYGWTLWIMILSSVLNAATTWGDRKQQALGCQLPMQMHVQQHLAMDITQQPGYPGMHRSRLKQHGIWTCWQCSVLQARRHHMAYGTTWPHLPPDSCL